MFKDVSLREIIEEWVYPLLFILALIAGVAFLRHQWLEKNARELQTQNLMRACLYDKPYYECHAMFKLKD